MLGQHTPYDVLDVQGVVSHAARHRHLARLAKRL
jgi:hypothetical protein